MSVEHVEFIVEEPSAEAALRKLLPRLLAPITFEVFPHQGKTDLLARLPDRLRGYAKWLPDTYRVVVVLDRDDDDCRELKKRLEKIAKEARLRSRTAAKGKPWQVVNRVAIEELEAWFFGDWAAVKRAYPRVHANIPSRSLYRNPDAIPGGTWEALERELMKVGYFEGGLRKIEAARAISEHLEPANNTSSSFRAFRAVLAELKAAS